MADLKNSAAGIIYDEKKEEEFVKVDDDTYIQTVTKTIQVDIGKLKKQIETAITAEQNIILKTKPDQETLDFYNKFQERGLQGNSQRLIKEYKKITGQDFLVSTTTTTTKKLGIGLGDIGG